jgi:hypothetical protein
MKSLLLIAAVMLFILAAIAGFGDLDWRWEGIVSCGLAAFAASFLPLPDRL